MHACKRAEDNTDDSNGIEHQQSIVGCVHAGLNPRSKLEPAAACGKVTPSLKRLKTHRIQCCPKPGPGGNMGRLRFYTTGPPEEVKIRGPTGTDKSAQRFPEISRDKKAGLMLLAAVTTRSRCQTESRGSLVALHCTCPVRIALRILVFVGWSFGWQAKVVAPSRRRSHHLTISLLPRSLIVP